MKVFEHPGPYRLTIRIDVEGRNYTAIAAASVVRGGIQSLEGVLEVLAERDRAGTVTKSLNEQIIGWINTRDEIEERSS